MSEREIAFARFPLDGGGEVALDIFSIEAVERKGGDPEHERRYATIRSINGGYYRIFGGSIDQQGYETAHEMVMATIASVAHAAAMAKNIRLDDSEADDEDDFQVPQKPEGFDGRPL